MKHRIIAGKYRGLNIFSPETIRSTKDNVRQSMFDVIAADLNGAACLDLFAGSGSFGIEALSRGASCVVFVDNSKECSKMIEKNLSRISPEDAKKARVLTMDARKAIISLSGDKEKFDIIFLDPPYYKNLVKKCLKELHIYDILTDSSLILAEHFKRDKIPEYAGQIRLVRSLYYGDTVISIFKKE